MSQNQEKGSVSEDEFHDAVNELPTKKQLSEQEVDELIEKHTELNLSDNEAAKEASGTTGGGGDAAAADDESKKHNFDCELCDDDLRLLEKDLTAEQLTENKEKADKLKLEGNEHFKNDEALRAVEIYTEALNICPLENTKERAILFGNRAAAKIKLDANKSAIDDCTKAVELWPEYVRALLRRAKLYELDDKLDEALADYKRVNELDGSVQEARQAIARLPPLIAARNEKLKTEMMSSLKDLGNMILKPFGLSTSNFQMQQDPATGSYSVNFSQNTS